MKLNLNEIIIGSYPQSERNLLLTYQSFSSFDYFYPQKLLLTNRFLTSYTHHPVDSVYSWLRNTVGPPISMINRILIHEDMLFLWMELQRFQYNVHCWLVTVDIYPFCLLFLC